LLQRNNIILLINSPNYTIMFHHRSEGVARQGFQKVLGIFLINLTLNFILFTIVLNRYYERKNLHCQIAC